MTHAPARIAEIVMWVALLALAAMTSHAADDSTTKVALHERSLDLRVGTSFLQARSHIIKSGWHPVPMHQNDDYEYSGAEKDLIDHGVVEVDSCSIDAGALCILYYRKAGQCLRVDTIGERISQMKVTRWTDECASAMQ